MNWIDYRHLPLAAGGFSQLYFDYLYDYPAVRRYFHHDFRDLQSIGNVIAQRSTTSIDRATLVRVLLAQHEQYSGSPQTRANITSLADGKTFAVVTGQQVGFLGGPLYTSLKALTAIKLAGRLNNDYPGYRFVPVFWLEGEDHDLAEMNHSVVFDQEGNPVTIEYLPGGAMPERNPGPVGEMVFDNFVTQCLNALEQKLQRTEFTEALLTQLRSSYAEQQTFSGAFLRWMNFLFGETGLVLLNANVPDLKRLVSPLFIQELSTFPATSQLVIERSAELEQQYHAQIKPRSINLFMFHRGGRYLIEPRDTDFSLKGTRHFLQKDELLRIAQEQPELLSPNVVLRPLVQDKILPTVAYIGGPGEIAYFAQLSALYDSFAIPPPVIYPRASVTIVDERLQRVMEKYDLELLELFGDPGQLTAKVVAGISEIKVEDLFARASGSVREALNELKFGLNEIDQTLLGALEGTASKVETNMGLLKEKALAAQNRKHDVAVRQIQRALAALLPNGGLQERQLSLVHYLNKYGADMVPWLTGEIDITGFKHQILTL